MSKLDYLLKYTSKPKSKKKTKNNVITTDDTIKAVEVPDEDIPVVESKFKGFKRIDNETPQDIQAHETPNPNKQPSNPPTNPQETVFRDLTGKVIDITQVSAKKPGKKIIKTTEVAAKEPVKSFTVSRSSKEYNDHLKSKVGVDDPMRNKITPDRLTYNKGLNIPNRFGIKAGVMWDGIDRSNGFEKLVLRKREENKANSKREVDEYELDFDN